MDEESRKLNLKTVEELILDEEKLVTYIYLSKKLCIHVNESKKLLCSFVEKYKNSKSDKPIYINYLVSGLIDSNSARTIVCSEDDLHRLKEELKTVFFEHIYSVSSGGPATDNVTLSAINNFSDFQSCIGLIKSKSCLKHSDTDIIKLKSRSYDSTLKTLLPKAQSTVNATKKVEDESTDHKSKKEEKIKVTVKSEYTDIKTSPKKPKDSPKKPAQSPANKNKNKPQKGITGFFNKQNAVKIETKTNAETTKMEVDNDLPEVVTIKVEKKKEKKVEKAVNAVSTTPEVKKEAAKVSNGTESKPTKNAKHTNLAKSKTVDIKKNAKVDKKRKRVLHLSDSEDDDPFKEETEKEPVDSEDEIPPTPTTNVVKITSGIINPRKKRKLVDKVYTDEDGYILTKKVEVYESCSDNDEPAAKENTKLAVMKENIVIKNDASPKKKNEAKKSKKKIPTPQKGKQATLMNFFSKK